MFQGMESPWRLSDRDTPGRPHRLRLSFSVPLLKNLVEGQLQRIADVLEAQFHPSGECIIRQGEQADSFFIIQSGEVRIHQSQAFSFVVSSVDTLFIVYDF